METTKKTKNLLLKTSPTSQNYTQTWTCLINVRLIYYQYIMNHRVKGERLKSSPLTDTEESVLNSFLNLFPNRTLTLAHIPSPITPPTLFNY